MVKYGNGMLRREFDLGCIKYDKLIGNFSKNIE